MYVSLGAFGGNLRREPEMNSKSLKSSTVLRLGWAVGALLVAMLFLLLAGTEDGELPEASTAVTAADGEIRVGRG